MSMAVTVKASRTRSQRSAEIVLMDKYWQGLSQLKAAGRRRVLDYLNSKHAEEMLDQQGEEGCGESYQ
jgi:hypothetical protein